MLCACGRAVVLWIRAGRGAYSMLWSKSCCDVGVLVLGCRVDGALGGLVEGLRQHGPEVMLFGRRRSCDEGARPQCQRGVLCTLDGISAGVLGLRRAYSSSSLAYLREAETLTSLPEKAVSHRSS